MTIDWSYIQNHFDWLGHIVEALVMAVIVAILTAWFYGRRTAALVGLAFAIGHFHGREKRDYETSVHMKPPHLEAYYMWRWNWDNVTDFWPTAIVLLMIAIVIAKKMDRN